VFRAFSLLPLPVLYAVCAVLAFLARVFRWRAGFVRTGLARCLPDAPEAERRRIAADFYRYLGELVAEAAHGARIAPEDLVDRLRLENAEIVEDLLGSGKRVMLLAAHHCNWEWLLLRCSTAFGAPLTAAYKPVSREPADRALVAMRSRFGASLVPAKRIVQHLIEQRGSVRLLALVADQSPPASSDQQSWRPFFGEETAFFRGPGWIGAKMGFQPVFIAMRREGRGRYVVRFVPLLESGERPDADGIISAYVQAVEAHAREHPAQYFWAYNRWKRARRLYD
jgi:Kdo2-lipid IVA lauroyltransferase/acyltransferase